MPDINGNLTPQEEQIRAAQAAQEAALKASLENPAYDNTAAHQELAALPIEEPIEQTIEQPIVEEAPILPEEPLAEEPAALPTTIYQPFTDTTISTKQKVMTPEEEGLLTESRGINQQRQQHLLDLGKIAKQEAEERIALASGKQAAQDEYTTKLDKVNEDYEKQHAIYEGEFAKETEKLKGMKVEDFWEDKSTFTKILAGISMALGAYGAGLTGGKNHAVGIINSAIEDDHKKQIARINHQKGIVENAGKMTDRLDRQFKIANLMAENRKAASYEKAATSAEVQIAKLGPEKAGVQAQQLVAQLRQQQVTTEQKVQEGLRALTTTTKQTKMKQVGPSYKDIQKTQKEDAKAAKAREALLVPGVGYGIDTKSATVLKTAKDRRDVVLGTLDQIQARVKKYGTGTMMDWTDDENRRLRQLLHDVAIDYSKLKDPQSVARESEVKGVLENQLFDPGFWQTGHGVKDQLTSFRGLVDNAYKTKVSAHLEPGTEQQEQVAPETRTIKGIEYEKTQGGWKRIK